MFIFRAVVNCFLEIQGIFTCFVLSGPKGVMSYFLKLDFVLELTGHFAHAAKLDKCHTHLHTSVSSVVITSKGQTDKECSGCHSSLGKQENHCRLPSLSWPDLAELLVLSKYTHTGTVCFISHNHISTHLRLLKYDTIVILGLGVHK